MAAFGDKAIAAAASYADRMVLDLVSPEMVRQYRTKLDAAAQRAGRPAPALAARIPAAVDPDDDSLAELVAGMVGYLAVPGYREMFTTAGFGAAAELAGAGATHDELIAAVPQDAARTVVLDAASAGDPGAERTLSAVVGFH